MTTEISDSSKILALVGAVFISLIAWIGNKIVDRTEELGVRLGEIEARILVQEVCGEKE